MTTTETEPKQRAVGAPTAVLLGLLGGAILIGVWWLALIVFGIESYLAPTPLEVFTAFTGEASYLLQNAWVTLTETAQGFGLAVVIGLTIGTLLAASRIVEQTFMPALVALNAVPKLAFAPLLVAWMGFGPGPKIVLVVLMCAFPIILSTTAGLVSTPADLAEMARSLSASRAQMFGRIRLPGALPQIFVGLKVAMPLAVIGALVGELFGASEGLGYVVQNSGADTGMQFAAITLLALMSIVLFYVVVLIERLAVPWFKGTTG
ncbi:ABC transporter permease [Actinoplanes sp. NPDC051633]|uniref:ABC transporter permease n=1 Tax=Actinoplanes sp. NPDC051633 TaxID=3155670 RepID=UPI00342F7826